MRPSRPRNGLAAVSGLLFTAWWFLPALDKLSGWDAAREVYLVFRSLPLPSSEPANVIGTIHIFQSAFANPLYLAALALLYLRPAWAAYPAGFVLASMSSWWLFRFAEPDAALQIGYWVWLSAGVLLVMATWPYVDRRRFRHALPVLALPLINMGIGVVLMRSMGG